MKRILPVLGAALLVLAACGGTENIKPPHELVDFTPQLTVQQLWRTQVGKGEGSFGIRLRPAYADGVLYVASSLGTLQAVDASSGRTLWKQSTRVKVRAGGAKKLGKDAMYAGGPVVADGLLVVGTLDGHVYALDASDGSQRWEQPVSAGVLAAPAIADNLVIVRTNDGKVRALNAADGSEAWTYDQDAVPALSLHGNGDLLATNGVVFFGSDDGRLEALRLTDGEKLWEYPLASGTGRTEIDRLDDADGSVLIQGSTVYAAAYHGQIVALDGPTAQVVWQRDFSSYTSMAIDSHMLVAVDDASDVWAFDPSDGSNFWKQDQLSWRWLSGPALQDGYVLVGDREGYLHWLRATDGAFVARTRLGKDAIRAQPLVVDGVAYVLDAAGRLAAYRVGAKAS